MMTQGELEKIPLPFQRHMSDLENRIMADLVERLKANREITSTADWQINRLKQLGLSNSYIKQQIKEAAGLNDAEIDKLYGDTVKESYIRNRDLYQKMGKEFIPFEKNRELQELLAAVKEQTAEQMHNITGSLGFAIRGPDGKIMHSPLKKFYQDTLDAAMFDMATGTFDYNTVLSRTIQAMTNSGLRSIDYDSGRSYRIDTAARMCISTGFNQIQAKINERVAKDLKTDYFEVSWHGGARPSHQVWQGRVYSKSELGSVCGLGSPGGLCGVHCYHSYNAYIPGVSTRVYTDAQLDQMNREENVPKTYKGREYTTYEALQEQRRLERLMRKQRQDIQLTKKGDADAMALQAKYRGTMDEYVKFSKKMKLPEQRERIFQDGLGNMSINAPKNVVIKPKNGIIKEKKKFLSVKSVAEAEEYAKREFGLRCSYKGVDLETANEWNRGLHEAFLQFPKLKDNFGFIGEAHERNTQLRPVAHDYYLNYLMKANPTFTKEQLEPYADKQVRKLMRSLSVEKGTFAQSWSPTEPFVEFRGITVNRDWGRDSTTFIEALKEDVKVKFHPVGCDTIRSVLDHEIGHQLDDLLDIRHIPKIQKMIDGKSALEITEELSRYSWDNQNTDIYAEAIAEAWAEYCNNPNPRAIAKTIGEIIIQEYKRKFGRKGGT